MSKENNTQSNSMGFFSVLTLIFIVLKLTNFISWSWWWVLSPIWIPLCIILGIFAILIASGFTD